MESFREDNEYTKFRVHGSVTTELIDTKLAKFVSVQYFNLYCLTASSHYRNQFWVEIICQRSAISQKMCETR